jgi:hypothetical protein
MPSRPLSNGDAEEQLPFTAVSDADFADDPSHAESGAHTVPRSRSRQIRAPSIASQSLSGSYSRNPVRSFAHQTSHGFAGMPPRRTSTVTTANPVQTRPNTRRKASANAAPSLHPTPSTPKSTRTARSATASPTRTRSRDGMPACSPSMAAGGRLRTRRGHRQSTKKTASPRHQRRSLGRTGQTAASSTRRRDETARACPA